MAVIDKDMMVLQNYTNSEDVLMGPYGETYPACYDANQALNVKAEEVSGAEEEEDPVPKTIKEIKAEPEVSCMCMSTVRQISQIWRLCCYDIRTHHHRELPPYIMIKKLKIYHSMYKLPVE
jgi:hypothetical protein